MIPDPTNHEEKMEKEQKERKKLCVYLFIFMTFLFITPITAKILGWKRDTSSADAAQEIDPTTENRQEGKDNVNSGNGKSSSRPQ